MCEDFHLRCLQELVISLTLLNLMQKPPSKKRIKKLLKISRLYQSIAYPFSKCKEKFNPNINLFISCHKVTQLEFSKVFFACLILIFHVFETLFLATGEYILGMHTFQLGSNACPFVTKNLPFPFVLIMAVLAKRGLARDRRADSLN